MKYKLFSGGELSEQAKLKQAKGDVSWAYLAPHYRNGSLFYVDPALELDAVGLAISNNETGRVEAWLKSGDLIKIEALHAAQWEGTETLFEALVVSPFVLCRTV